MVASNPQIRVQVAKLVDIAFLGIADQAAYVRDQAVPGLMGWNILGLRPYFLTPFVPAMVRGVKLAFAVREVGSEPIKVHIRSASGLELGWLQLHFQPLAISSNTVQEVSLTSDTPVLDLAEGWQFFVAPLNVDALAHESGEYQVFLETNDGEKPVGSFLILAAMPTPLTEERIAAIRSDPHAAKAVRMQISCNQCRAGVKVYAALEATQKWVEEGWIWYRDLPDEFHCNCGKTTIDLRHIRENMHLLLGYRHLADDNISLVPLYEQSTLRQLFDTFDHLLNSDPKEETIQKFIEKNTIILHEYPAVRIIFKPTILTQYRADFGIVTPQKELILIEIEHTRTKLLRKNGGVASELSHAIDQVEDWLRTADDHRVAFLSELSIDPSSVSLVRGVVIAGRDRGQDAKHLRALRGRDRGRVSFRTFDDLLFSVEALARDMGKL